MWQKTQECQSFSFGRAEDNVGVDGADEARVVSRPPRSTLFPYTPLFLSSTRVIFAAAFDRVLPEWAANISAKRRVPYGSLILMIVPSLVVSAIWAYQPSFQGIFLWATGVIAITFLGTVVAAAILPWRRKDIFENSPISRFR